MKEEVKKFVEGHLNTLKGIEDKKIYEHIISVISKMYTGELTYVQAIEEIEANIEGITDPAHQNEWGAMYSLCGTIQGKAEVIKHYYADELIKNPKDCIREVTGEIYNLIHDNT